MPPVNDANSLRFIIDEPLSGAVNMARDDALLEFIGHGKSPSTLRLYGWQEPTISLGYFQRIAEAEKLDGGLERLPVVRRPTGGGAILHDLELTYSLTAPLDHPLVAAGTHRLYALAHDAIIMALEQIGARAMRSGVTDDSGPTRGPFFCFARRHALDLVIGADKIAGSAQRRTRWAVLQHGSIVLANRFSQHPAYGSKIESFEANLVKMKRVLPAAFEHVANYPVAPGSWTETELSEAKTRQGKFQSEEWTRRM